MVKLKRSPHLGSRTRFRVGHGYVTRSEILWVRALGPPLVWCGLGSLTGQFPRGPSAQDSARFIGRPGSELVKGSTTREKAQNSEGKPAIHIRIPTLYQTLLETAGWVA